MGEVIAFRPQDETRRAAARDAEAVILFFTGVRYQHGDSAAISRAPQPPSPQDGDGGGKLPRGGGRRRG